VIEQAPPGFHLDKHVQIAIRLLVTPGRGPEKPKVVGAVLSGEAQDLIPMGSNGCMHWTVTVLCIGSVVVPAAVGDGSLQPVQRTLTPSITLSILNPLYYSPFVRPPQHLFVYYVRRAKRLMPIITFG